jgi:hypothetical protein
VPFDLIPEYDTKIVSRINCFRRSVTEVRGCVFWVAKRSGTEKPFNIISDFVKLVWGMGNNKLSVAESFLGSRHSLSLSRISEHFMELEGSLPCSQELPTGWSLSRTRSVQSIPFHPISLRSILILSSHLRLRLPSGPFPSDFPANTLYAFLFFLHACYMPYLDLILLIVYGEEYKLRGSSPLSFHLSSVQIFFRNTPFSNIFTLCSSLDVRDQVLRPYKTTGKNYSSVCFKFCVFRQQATWQKFWTEW